MLTVLLTGKNNPKVLECTYVTEVVLPVCLLRIRQRIASRLREVILHLLHHCWDIPGTLGAVLSRLLVVDSDRTRGSWHILRYKKFSLNVRKNFGLWERLDTSTGCPETSWCLWRCSELTGTLPWTTCCSWHCFEWWSCSRAAFHLSRSAKCSLTMWNGIGSIRKGGGVKG